MKPLLLVSGCLALGVLGAVFVLRPDFSRAQVTGADAGSAVATDTVARAHAAFPAAASPTHEDAKAELKRHGVEMASATQAGAMGLPEGDPARALLPGKRLVAYHAFHVDQPYVALTFDDGPNPETTPKLLDALKARGVKATFFVLGSRAAAYPELVKRIVAEGHEVGNHSWNHPQLTKIPLAAADKQIADTSEAIFQASGRRPVYVRPPYGAMKGSLREHLAKTFGVSFIYWTVDPLDWKFRDPKVVHDKILAEVKPGAIVLAHDIHATTVDAMPQVIDDLAARGYRFATISQMVAMDKPVPVKVASALPAAPKKPKKKVQKPHPVPVSRPGVSHPTPSASIGPRPQASNRAVASSSGLY